MINFAQYLTPRIKINSKGIIELNVNPKIIKLLEENIRDNICDLELGRVLRYDMSSTIHNIFLN